jgi:uncharacterized membrane protein
MKMRFTPTTAFILAAIAFAGHVAFHYPQLPQDVATHFDWRGRPNGFASREALLVLSGVAVLVFGLLFWAVGFVRWLPPQFVNIPNKGHWLSPERREASLAFVADWARWVLALVMLLQALIMGGVLHANLRPPVELGDGPLYETAGFLVALAGMIVWLYRRFPRPQ